MNDLRQVPIGVYEFITGEKFSDDEIVGNKSFTKEKVIIGDNLACFALRNPDTNYEIREFSLFETVSRESYHLISISCYQNEEYEMEVSVEAELLSIYSPITRLNCRQVFNKALDLIDQCDN